MVLAQVAQKLLVVYKNTSLAHQVAAWLLEKLTGKKYAQILIEQDLILTSEQKDLLVSWLDQIILQHKPYQYILGNVPFLNLDILVEPPVLIPRLETEHWVDLLIKNLNDFKKHDLKVLELCSGSGCIGLALAKKFPEFQVVAVDLTRQACDLINKNKMHNLINNLQVIQGDLYTNLVGQKFDLIVSNPPYVPENNYQGLDLSVQLWEDRLALVSPGFDLAIITRIIEAAPNYLQHKYIGLPQLWLEIDETQGVQVSKLMQAKFEQVVLLPDQFGRQRIVVGR